MPRTFLRWMPRTFLRSRQHLPLATEYADYEIVGYEPTSGSVLQWDAAGDTLGIPCAYVSHETPEEFGLDNLTGIEMARLLLTGWIPR